MKTKLLLLVFAGIVAVDLGSKGIATSFANPVQNLGMSFSMLSGDKTAIGLMIVCIVVAVLLLWQAVKRASMWLIFIASGAFGNGIDRLIHLFQGKPASVTDFIHYPWFTGNIADIAVVLGAVLFAISILRKVF